MGNDVYVYDNPENSLHGWIKKYYPGYAQWVLSCEEITATANTPLPWNITPTLINLVKTLGPELPDEALLKQYPSQSELVTLIEHLMREFDDFLYCHFDQDLELKERYSSCLLYPHHFSTLSALLAEALGRGDLSDLIEQVFGRLYTDFNAVPQAGSPVPDMGFWTAEECGLLRGMLSHVYDPQQPQYASIEAQIRTYVLADDDRFENAEPDAVLAEVRKTCTQITHALHGLPEGWGVFIQFVF